MTSHFLLQITNLTPNQAAAQAIQLFSQEARLCDGTQPSKVARTTLEPGPASLAKSLPVKNVNPTCSDEGTILAECKTAICFLLDSIYRQTSTTEDDINSIRIDNLPNRDHEMHVEKRNNGSLPSSDIIILEEKSSKSYSNRNEEISMNNSSLSSNPSNVTMNEGNLLQILSKHNIRIPNFNIERRRRRSIRYKRQYRRVTRSKSKKKIQQARKTRAIRKRTSRKLYTRESVTKLLILTLYLKYLEKERYTKRYLPK